MVDRTLMIQDTTLKTLYVHDWMKNLDDYNKQRFAINWRMPHSLFNVACQIFPGKGDTLQGVDWYSIYKSRDMGLWSHGGPVIIGTF